VQLVADSGLAMFSLKNIHSPGRLGIGGTQQDRKRRPPQRSAGIS
jgi:hypothetical protein